MSILPQPIAHDITCGLDGPGEMPTCPACLAALQRESRVTPERTVRRILLAVRRRLHRQPRHQWPPLDQPTCLVGLILPSEITVLARRGRWPLTPTDIAYLRRTPRQRARRRRRDARRVLDSIADLARTDPVTLRELLWSVLRHREGGRTR